MDRKTFRDYYNWVILACSFFLGLIWILRVDTQPISDFKYYHELAQSIAAGGPWGDTYTTVGYSVFLALFYKFFGASLYVAKGLNMVLSVINNLLVLQILKRSPIRKWERRVIFTLFALFPSTIFYNSIVGTEILFTLILLGLTLIFLSRLRYKYLLMGVLVGLNTLIKPFFIAYFLVILLAEMISQHRVRPALLHGLIVFLISSLVLAPWLYRNDRLIGEFTWVSNNGGIVLYLNNNSQNKNAVWMPAEDVENSLVNTLEYKQANATEQNKMLSRAAKAWILSHPREFAILGFKRLQHTFGGSLDDIGYSFYGSGLGTKSQDQLHRWGRFMSTPVYLLGIASVLGYSLRYLWRLRREKISSLESYLIILLYMFAGIYFITEGQSRYAFPTLFIFIYFAISLPKLFGARPERNT